ncbi:MAG TPA: hypothetical protein VJB08_03055 [Candidatus Nanoarchaeia archaeon]|nr:hypothetical protein [Candidatus Nanoarchaeia archaeon]
MAEGQKGMLQKLRRVYEEKLHILWLIPNILLLIALIQIGLQFSQTGEILHRGVSLRGGFTVTVPTNQEFSIDEIQDSISRAIAYEVSVRRLSAAGAQLGYIIESSVDPEKEGNLELLLAAIERNLNMNRDAFSVEIIGSSLGSAFFKQALKAMLIAFVLMSIVVAIYFRTFVPSLAVILAAFSDIVITMSITNILGMKIGTAGIAAFLMLIGYSVDTDILLTTRVMRRQQGSVMDRILGAMKTGSTLSLTTLAAAIAGLAFSQSEVIRQIMVIIIIGLVVDFIATWLQNAAIISMYMKKRA